MVLRHRTRVVWTKSGIPAKDKAGAKTWARSTELRSAANSEKKTGWIKMMLVCTMLMRRRNKVACVVSQAKAGCCIGMDMDMDMGACLELPQTASLMGLRGIG